MTPEEEIVETLTEVATAPAPPAITPEQRAQIAAQELTSFMQYLQMRYGVDYKINIDVVPLQPSQQPQAEAPPEEPTPEA